MDNRETKLKQTARMLSSLETPGFCSPKTMMHRFNVFQTGGAECKAAKPLAWKREVEWQAPRFNTF